MRSDKSENTRGGPCVSTDAFTHANTAFSVDNATNHRILILRGKPEKMTWKEAYAAEQVYRNAQASYCLKEHPGLTILSHRLQIAFAGWKGWYQEAKEHHADPHPKRELRVAAWESQHADGLSALRLWLKNGIVLYKMKTCEMAKFLKAARMIGDLGVAASLQGFRSTSIIKECMDGEDIVVGDARYRFCKRPSTEDLKDIFNRLLNPTETHFFVYFSDDSCYSRRLPDGTVRMFNVDISKCDASHTPALFTLLKSLVPTHVQDDVQILIEQCTAPILIRHPLHRKQKVKLQPNGPRLYSGSTLTTVINNLANLLVASCLVRAPCPTGKAAHQTLCDSVAECGYLITLAEAIKPQDLQFLKNSPAYDIRGELQPLLNIGVLLRASGTAKGQIPGTIPLHEKFRAFQYGLVHGMYPRVRTPLIDNMLAASAGPTYAEVDKHLARTEGANLHYKAIGTDICTFTSKELFARYDMTQAEIETIVYDFGRSAYGDRHASVAASKILHRDYSLECHGCPVPADW